MMLSSSPHSTRGPIRQSIHDLLGRRGNKHHLAQGLVTSPILADQTLGRVDQRIGAACAKAGLSYTRFVDDITVSGPFDLQESGFARLVMEILEQDGFKMNAKKQQFGRLEDGVPITGIRVVNRKLDVRKEYVAELERELEDASRLARGGEFVGPYYTPNQLRGKILFVSSVNPGRGKALQRRYSQIPFNRLVEEAAKRGLVQTKRTSVTRRLETVRPPDTYATSGPNETIP